MQADGDDPIDALLEALLDLPDAEQAAELERLCAAHPLHAEALHRRLALYRELDAPLSAQVFADQVPRQIGPYRVIGELGRGGMGVVYRAEQTEPVARQVAVKVVRSGLATSEVLARFERERRTLAAMNHHCIAKVFDAGRTADGAPYFVMELVDGAPLTTYCDRRGLTLVERVRLFQQVCEGVHHAHQKGVVHRDLKPGNVLVVREGDRAIPKILDFGLAKATRRVDAASALTVQVRVLGTLEYMSPEQAAGDAARTDARSDVYSLGVMLYELLCGELPFPSQQLRLLGDLEASRVVRDVEPKRPSSRIDDTPLARAAAKARHLTPATLRRALSGDLDWIVMRAMRKEPEHRYDSATALAADLERFLTHIPVVAGPPSTGYRLRKFLRRCRLQVTAAGLILAALATGAWATFAQYRRAEGESRALAGKVREFDMLAGIVLHQRALASAARLFPAWPETVPALEAWLRDDCGTLERVRSEVRTTLATLETRALPRSEAEALADRRSHPRFPEREPRAARLATLRRAQALLEGKQTLVLPELSPEHRRWPPEVLRQLAWTRVAPVDKPGSENQRPVFGEEALGLAYARAAVAGASSPQDTAPSWEMLAWAELANGQEQAALAAIEKAIATAPVANQGEYRSYRAGIQRRIAESKKLADEAEARLIELESALAARRTFTFARPEDRFLHTALGALVTDLDAMQDNLRPAIVRRLHWAKTVAATTRTHPQAKLSWDEARAALARTNGCAGIELDEVELMGLVPLGVNPSTHLLEFYDLRSAWDGEADPRSLELPIQNSDGSWKLEDETGIVFVLLPGGAFWMGAQAENASGGNYDAAATPVSGPPHPVTLAPFLIAKHELTQGQWRRLCEGGPEAQLPSAWQAGRAVGGKEISWRNPVECVDWTTATRVLSEHGMLLPTEAQWEYACRAGTSTPWYCPQSELPRRANLADARAQSIASLFAEAWDDGFAVHAPVGAFAPNAFGLHDMIGNVFEWCRDSYDGYRLQERSGDGLRPDGPEAAIRVARGGSYVSLAVHARSAARVSYLASKREGGFGVRPVRPLRRTP